MELAISTSAGSSLNAPGKSERGLQHLSMWSGFRQAVDGSTTCRLACRLVASAALFLPGICSWVQFSLMAVRFCLLQYESMTGRNNNLQQSLSDPA